ncbi:PadR family transcriptional regulator [Brevibacillus agri]|uniref:PadR family transcriptional regulator n=1 Tax=Brevibacillus agri TaxID=51101 RepID=UPI00046FE4A8|nr:PadR family transcriptional regulator [Brevibacillus agri]
MGDKSISSDIIRGHIDAIILRVLCEKDSYGYEIIKTIFKNSGEQYELKEPSLYTSLKRLEAQKLIVSYWGDESQGGRRKYYQVTEAGRAAFASALASWKVARQLIDQLIERREEA